MAIREVLKLGNPLLRQQSEAITDFGGSVLHPLAQDLADTLAHWRSATGYGRGIAAPQIGVLQRVIYLNLGAEPLLLVNPEIVSASAEKITIWDGCLSFLSIFMQVERFKEIEVRYQNAAGEVQVLSAGLENDLSELLQHEIDHLDGILAVDRVTDLQTIVVRDEFERRYKQASPYAAAARGGAAR